MTMNQEFAFAICGGGSGGHAIPGINIGNEIRRRFPNSKACYIGGQNSIEQKLALGEGFTFKAVIVSRRKGKLSLNNFLLPFKLMASIFQSAFFLIRINVKFVIGTGGFSAFPCLFAAKLLGIKYFLQEQNVYPGLTTRLFARGASTIYLGFKGAEKFLQSNNKNLLMFGNPIDDQYPRMGRNLALNELGLDSNNKTIFITGGSQGAKSINTAIYGIYMELLGMDFNIIWQTGKTFSSEINKNDKNLRINEFFTPMEMALGYNCADLVISRSGAMTLTELITFSRPSLLIPYPFAGNHQLLNAQVLLNQGCAEIILDEKLSPSTLLNHIASLFENGRISKMQKSVDEMKKMDSAKLIVDDIVKALEC